MRLFSNRSQRYRRVCHWCSYHILTSSVIYYWTDARQHGIFLFYIITKQITTHKAFVYFKILQCNITRKPTLTHFAEDEKKPFDVIYYLYKIKQFHWLLCVAKNCDWSRKITPLSNLTRASVQVEWKLTVKAELYCEKNLEQNAGKINSVFVIKAAPWAEKLGRCLENCRSWKNPRQTCGCDQPRGHLIRVLNERSVNDGGDFCLLWLVILKSASLI